MINPAETTPNAAQRRNGEAEADIGGRDGRAATSGRDTKGGSGTDVGGHRGERHDARRRDAFQAAMARGGQPAPETPPLRAERNGAAPQDAAAGRGEEEGAARLLALVVPPTAEAARSAPVSAAALPSAAAAQRVAAIEALALKIEGELDVALRVSARSLGGGIELNLALDGGGSGLSSLKVIARGAELTVSLALGPDVGAAQASASAQDLAAALARRFPHRVVRVERAERGAVGETGVETLSSLFARPC